MKKTLAKNLFLGALASSALLLTACSSTSARSSGSTYSYSHSHSHPYAQSAYSSHKVAHANTIKNNSDADEVHVYFSNKWLPKHYAVLGNISVTNPHRGDADQRTISDKLRAKAASLGGNGVIDVRKGATDTTAKAILIQQ